MVRFVKYSILEILKGYKEKFSPLEVANEIARKIGSDNKKLNAYVFDEEIFMKKLLYLKIIMKKIKQEDFRRFL